MWVTEIGTDVNSLSGIHSISVGIGYGSHVIEGRRTAGRGAAGSRNIQSVRTGDPHAAASHISRATSTRARCPKTASNHQP